MHYCSKCGSPIEDGAGFCPYCGARIAAPRRTVPAAQTRPAEDVYEPYVPHKPAPAIDSLESDFLPEEDRAARSDEHVFSADRLPEKYQPISHWEYFGLALLFMIPVIGWVFMFVLSFRNTNINRRNFAMSFLCFFLLFGVAALVVSLFFSEQFADLMTKLSSLF